MSYVILRKPDLLCEVDLDNFDPIHLTAGARIYYEMSSNAYYSDDINEVDINKMIKLK